MPGYAGLFARGDARGPALVAYLQSLGQTNLTDHYLLSATWQPAKAAALAAEKLDGVALVKQYCGTCHSPNGATRRTWKSAFKKLPPDFTQGPFAYVPPSADTNWRWQRFAEIIKFGLPGTDMPGHEYLPDAAVAAMARYLTVTTAKIEP
jgi:cytochrome c oxidase cbb3-type subunit 2